MPRLKRDKKGRWLPGKKKGGKKGGKKKKRKGRR